MRLPSSEYNLNILKEPKERKSRKEKEGDKGKWYSILGHRGEELTPKRRRGLLLRALRGGLVTIPKPKGTLAGLPKVRKSKDEPRPEPRYYFELHRYVRRKL